jgi:hypothetical protein
MEAAFLLRGLPHVFGVSGNNLHAAVILSLAGAKGYCQKLQSGEPGTCSRDASIPEGN